MYSLHGQRTILQQCQYIFTFVLIINIVSVTNQEVHDDFYSFSAKDIENNVVPFEKYRGKVSVDFACFVTNALTVRINFGMKNLC